MDRAARKPILPVAGCLLAVLLWSMAAADAAGAPVAAHDDPAEVARVADLVDAGQFAAAEQRIAAHGSLPAAGSEHALAFQRERMRRLRLDFSLDTGAAKGAVRRAIPDLRDDEFERWDRLGLLEHLDIDGARFYFKRAPGNLLRLSDQARARQPAGTAPPSEGPFEALTPYHAQVVQAASNTGKAYVLPQRVEVTQSLTVKADAVPAGTALRVWIPYPRDIPGQQTQIQWRGSTPGHARIAPPSTLQRTAYLQGTAVAGQPTRFEIRYALTVAAQHTRIDPARVQPTPSDPALAPYLVEQPPHVRFTPALRLFSDQVLQGETRPAEIARRLFDAVDSIPWAGAREYSTLTNISDYALRAGHADCGQQTLLLITLLRMNGIPARWQSGMVFADDAVGYNNLHDWGALYLAPYGWVPMDVTTGRLHSADPTLRDFYFGGLDAYRIAFNDAFSQPLVPAKRFARSDTVDSQRGEVEWDGGNLYFDQWNYDFQSHIVPLDATR